MNEREIIRMAREAGGYAANFNGRWIFYMGDLERFAALVIDADRKFLEEQLLKLKSNTASVSQYVQGRWDLIGEFQDILRGQA